MRTMASMDKAANFSASCIKTVAGTVAICPKDALLLGGFWLLFRSFFERASEADRETMNRIGLMPESGEASISALLVACRYTRRTSWKCLLMTNCSFI